MMKRFLPFALLMAALSPFSINAQSDKAVNISVYDGAVFYDGYRMNDNPDMDLEDGILRHSCSLYSIHLTDEQIDKIGEKLNMHVDVQALCDNYDRIGNVNIAFVPKGEETYDSDQTQRIEIGRFITPFMDMNKEPNVVPYDYELSYLSPILRDKGLRERYDYWLELEIFGVPYAANTQIKGCKDRNDVFKGSLTFSTSLNPAPATEENVLVPIVIKKPEYKGHNLNNYSAEGTDTIGKTTKTYTFELPNDVSHAQIVLITSNHGANAGGEEYKRRMHYVYLDDALVLSYKPGRESCEPFRQYNTQANGIYGSRPMSDSEWQSFSNWCPGDVIDNRLIYVGDLTKGEHKIRITVPNARFVDKQGDIPVSIYFHAAKYDASGINPVTDNTNRVKVSVADGVLSASSDTDIVAMELYDLTGRRLYNTLSETSICTDGFPRGIYLLNVELADGVGYTQKVMF